METLGALNHAQVQEILPHRAPMLLIDEVSGYLPMEWVEGTLFIDPTWDIFRGHFPGAPVFPGVLAVECMAQAADVMLMTAEQYRGKTPLFAGIERARFRRKISPGDQVRVRATFAGEDQARRLITCEAELHVAEGLAATATVTLAMR